VDPNKPTQAVPAAAYKLPSRAAHAAFIRKVWWCCIVGAAVCFVSMAGTVLYMGAMGHDSKAIVNVQLIIVYIVLPVYAIGYVAPTLASSLIKMSLGLEVSRESATILERVDAAIDARAAKLDRLVERTDKLVAEIDACTHPLAKKFDEMAAHMAAIRARVERDTTPLPLKRRPAEAGVPAGGGDGDPR